MIKNVLSAFDGMSCGQIALNKAGISYDNYYASEIDKYAIEVTQYNYPNTIQLGDITKININELPTIDLLIGGSPCQGFSFAGKQLNFEDPRSRLFFEFVKLKNALNPKYFLLENVRMKKEYIDVISEYLGVEPILINSSKFSAQNRERLYWTNIPITTTIEDKNILLKDILEDDGDFKYGECELKEFNENSICHHIGNALDINGNDSIKRIYASSGKSPTLDTMQGGNRHPKVLINGTNSYRRLTPLECERLQTVPDNYTSIVSNSQRYKMLGNGWTVDVIAFIFNQLKEF
mgnify:FL=1|jgi:DNA-cytosine methyltransferase